MDRLFDEYMMMSEIDENPSNRSNEIVHEYKEPSSTSSDSDNEKPFSHQTPKKKHLFGRTEPLHTVLGGGTFADIILWRNKQLSGSILAGATVVWIIFEWIDYQLLTFICHSLILSLVAFAVWYRAASFLKRPPPMFPEVLLPEDMFMRVAQIVRYQINEAFDTFSYVASWTNFGTSLKIVAGLYMISKVGGWFSFLTLLYLAVLLVYTGPVLYEKYEDQVDRAGAKAIIEIRKQYAVIYEKVLQKIPEALFSAKKQN